MCKDSVGVRYRNSGPGGPSYSTVMIGFGTNSIQAHISNNQKIIDIELNLAQITDLQRRLAQFVESVPRECNLIEEIF
jgi:hypothetical protein